MADQTKFVPLELGNSAVVMVETTVIGEVAEEEEDLTGEEVESDVSSNYQYLKQATDAIEGIANTLKQSLEKIQPTKATVEFGLEFGYESGQITAMIVKGGGKANLKITLEWQKPPAP
ncbi:MAG: hypothetical protein F6J92_27675 [Symploca sp. SIO1A3]|nr:hypothetical protein [Symploca sp. SIO1A3]